MLTNRAADLAHANQRFTTTHWSQVYAAGESIHPEAQAALENLCAAYWYPLYAFARRSGDTDHDAMDCVQSFFFELIETRMLRRADPARGRFRSFLLACFVNSRSNNRRKSTAEKRGGQQVSSWQALFEEADQRYLREPRDNADPSTIYHRTWVRSLVERAMQALESEYRKRGEETRFQLLLQFLPGQEQTISQAEAGRLLGLSEKAVNQATFAMRRRLRDILLNEIGQTCATPEDLAEERQFVLTLWSA